MFSRSIIRASILCLAFSFLSGCDSHVAAKAVSVGARAVIQHEENAGKPDVSSVSYFQDLDTKLCFVRMDTTSPMGEQRSSKVERVECSEAVLDKIAKTSEETPTKAPN